MQDDVSQASAKACRDRRSPQPRSLHNVRKTATMRAHSVWQTCRAFRVQVRAFAAAAEASPIKVKYQPAPHSGNIRILLLDRPEARNALSRRLVTDLKRHVDEVHAEGGAGSTRALIIASNTDKAFCAGADLRERKGMTQEEYAFDKSSIISTDPRTGPETS